MELNPDLDGVDHINVYSKAATELGRFLTNFAHSPFTSSEHGRFKSIEGYWYWLGCTHADKDRLRALSGFEAKKVGRELNALDWQDTPDFKQRIKKAIFAKIFNNPKMALLLKNSALPLKHYYNYKGKIVEPQEGRWVIEFIEEVRLRMNNLHNLVYKNQDLFSAPSGSHLAHSCNAQGNWGAGIALKFKEKFPESYEKQYVFCKNNPINNVLGRTHLSYEDGFGIISLFTSAGYGSLKSSKEVILSKTTQAISLLIRSTQVREIWIPKINSGYFGVPWEETEIILIGLLIKNPDFKIIVCDPK